MSGEAGGPGWHSKRPWERDRQPCRWLVMVKPKGRVAEQRSRCLTASSHLEWPWDQSWGNAAKPTALPEGLSIPAQ